MNKKKSRKNKKKRDNPHKSTHTRLNPSNANDTYLDNFNLTQQQQSAIKFLSEALAISSQEAHIICNECKWEQSEFPSNLEAAQTMLHWNKKNTKSKIKREQNKYKHDKSNKKLLKSNNTKNHTHTHTHPPHHSPNKSPSKHANHSNNSPKFCGFVPHTHKPSNKRHRDKNHDTSTPKKHKNRVVITVSPSRALPPNRRSSSPPNITAEMGPPHTAKTIQFLNRAYMSRGRTRGYMRGRARGRGIMLRNVKYKNHTPHPHTRDKIRPMQVPESPQSSDDMHANMYVHETLEQELRREQVHVNVIKLPKEFEKDLDANLSLFEAPPVQVGVPVMNGHILQNEIIPKNDVCDEHEVVGDEHNASMPISPKNNISPQKMPMPPPITQQAFLSSMDEHAVDEFKEQSFMFVNSPQTQVPGPVQVDSVDARHDTKEQLRDEVEQVDDSVDSMSFGERYSELFEILDGTLVIGHSDGNLAPHLCMTFDTLLDLANYQNGEILHRNDLMEWYKISKHKLVYNREMNINEDVFNNINTEMNESTQHLFDEFEKRERMKTQNEEKQYNGAMNSDLNINKKQREKQKKPTRPPLSAKYNHFISANTVKKEINNSKSVPNNSNATSSRRERVISPIEKAENNSKAGLNSNAKTFEPTKSRSSSRTKSLKSVTLQNNKSNTPVLSLQASKSITPQIQIPQIMQMNNIMPQTQPQPPPPPRTKIAPKIRQNSLNGMHINQANINLTNVLNTHRQRPLPRQRPQTQVTQPQTVTIREPQYVQQVQNLPQQTYLISNTMNPSQISINALQRVNSLPLSHQSSNGSLGGNSIEFVSHHKHRHPHPHTHPHPHPRATRPQHHSTHTHTHNHPLYQRTVAQTQPIHATQQQTIFTGQTVYKQPQTQTQTQFITAPVQQQQFIIKSQRNNNHYIVDNSVNHQQILQTQNINNLQHIQQNHPILQ